MQELNLSALRDCLEGVVPSVIATAAPDGTPNATYVSQVHYVDERHVALSFQFFNKTRENILANPHAMAQVIDPGSGMHYRLTIRYLRTETEGPLFESMKAKLAGIASHTGMSKVFRLLGADVYEVSTIEGPGCEAPHLPSRYNRLTALRSAIQQLRRCNHLDVLFDEVLMVLAQYFQLKHAMLLLHDEPGRRLFIVASHGYDVSGVGAEILLGTGVIGVAAEQRAPIRIMYMTGEYTYNLAVRETLQRHDPTVELETEIPFAGLPDPHSQLAVPIVGNDDLIGVLYTDSRDDLRFTYEDEDALVILCDFLASRIAQLRDAPEPVPAGTVHDQPPGPAATGPPVKIRHYAVNDSVFIDEEYLIKGVAGAICWKLLVDFNERKRVEFSNRELRLDPAIRLPDIGDNLEARLILLRKRLHERCDFLRIEKSGRGRFQLKVDRAIVLEQG